MAAPIFTGRGVPEWFHHRGCEVELGVVNPNIRTLRLSSTTAGLLVMSQANIGEDPTSLGWVVAWEIKHSHTRENSDQITMSSEDLSLAFGLDEVWDLEEIGEDLDQFEILEKPGLFIRSQRFLNISGPGTGRNGDKNVSIEIDNKMRDALHAIMTL